MSADTSRKRVSAFLDSIHPRAKYAAVSDPKRPLLSEDLRAVLNANAGYERIIAEQRREAVEDYKKALAADLRSRIEGRAADTHPDMRHALGYDTALEDVADDLEDGTL